VTADRRSVPLDDADRLLTERAVADRLGVSARSLREKRRDNLPHPYDPPRSVKVGRLVRYRSSAVEDYIDNHET
jgi:predicted DNA-binding transcriptional regulator AlpA